MRLPRTLCAKRFATLVSGHLVDTSGFYKEDEAGDRTVAMRLIIGSARIGPDSEELAYESERNPAKPHPTGKGEVRVRCLMR